MSKRNQMIGRQGEKRFSLLCSEAGVTCNRSEEDDNGWDMVIEFPARPQPLVALDMRAGPTPALVQVKTTEGAGRTVSISLDNALRYVQSPLPTFVVLVVLGEDGNVNYYVRHVWLSLIGAWLKTAREADAEGLTATNLKTVSVTFSEEDRRGPDLLAWIEGEARSQGRDYSAKKGEIARTIGFAEHTGSALLTIRRGEAFDPIDMQLGLQPRIRVERFVYTSERFAIVAGRPEIDFSDVLLEIMPEGRAAIFDLDFPDGRRRSVKARLFLARDGDRTAFRVKTACLDVVLGPARRIDVKLHINEMTAVSVDDLSLFAGVNDTEPSAKIGMELRIEDDVYRLGTISMDGRRAVDWQWFAMAVDALRSIASFAGRATPTCSPGAVFAVSGALELLGSMTGHSAMRLNILPAPGIPKRFSCFLGYCCVTVGDLTYGAVSSRPIVNDRRTGRRREFDFAPPTLLHAAVDGEADRLRKRVVDAYLRHLERLSASSKVLALGDLRVIASGGPDEPIMGHRLIDDGNPTATE